MLTPNTFTHKTPKIIDVSHWEGYPNWDRVMLGDDAPQGVIMKASDFFGGVQYADKSFDYSRPILNRLKVDWGAYHYFNPEYDAARQAYWFLERLGGDIGAYPPVLDLEKRDYRNANGKWVRMPKGRAMAAVVKTWLDIVERETGKIPMIYTSASYVYEYMTSLGMNQLPDASRYPLWLAWYPYSSQVDFFSAPPKLAAGWKNWHLWQYSEAGVLSGMPYDGVDLNVASTLFAASTVEPPPDPTYPIAAIVSPLASPYLNVRAGAGTNYPVLTRLLPGADVTIYEVIAVGANEWARIGDGRWAAKVYGGKIYLQ